MQSINRGTIKANSLKSEAKHLRKQIVKQERLLKMDLKVFNLRERLRMLEEQTAVSFRG